MGFDPASLDLGALFTDAGMFKSRRAWRRAGFDVLDPAKDTECMVASHPSAPGYLFKRYPDDVSPSEQNENYDARIECAGKLARFIEAEGLRHVVVPRKHLHDLPRSFGRSARVLVVERLDICGKEESEQLYHDVAEPVLRDLLRVIVEFRGLDSNAKNVPFTRDGRIAFVDLENWRRKKDEQLRSIGRYLSKERRKLAWKIIDELERA